MHFAAALAQCKHGIQNLEAQKLRRFIHIRPSDLKQIMLNHTHLCRIEHTIFVGYFYFLRPPLGSAASCVCPEMRCPHLVLSGGHLMKHWTSRCHIFKQATMKGAKSVSRFHSNEEPWGWYAMILFPDDIK